MKKFFVGVLQLALVALIMGGCVVAEKKAIEARPLVAVNQAGDIIAVEYEGIMYPSLAAAGLSEDCSYETVKMFDLLMSKQAKDGRNGPPQDIQNGQ